MQDACVRRVRVRKGEGGGVRWYKMRSSRVTEDTQNSRRINSREVGLGLDSFTVRVQYSSDCHYPAGSTDISNAKKNG